MANVAYLSPGQDMPDHGENASWLIIEASADGCFFGTGAGYRSDGEAVFYLSLTENDHSLGDALTAAQKWADTNRVSTIWVRLMPTAGNLTIPSP